MVWRRNKPADRERRREPPRVSGGQLSWLVASILMSGAPHLLHVHPWVPIVVITILLWRVVAALKRWPLPSTWIRVPLTFIGLAGVLISYRQLSGLSAGSALLLIMAAMKLLETRGHRDRAIVIFICYFLLFSTFLREQAIWSAAYLGLCVLTTTAALFQTARIGPTVPAPHAMAHASRLLLQALPVALLLFLLFPRIPGPFWSLPQSSGQAVAGLSGELNPGDISELALSDKVAFRVHFGTAPPPASTLYWRGPVMTVFDGRKWMQRPAWPSASAQRARSEESTVEYELTLEPHGQHWLLALETPLTWDARGARLGTAAQLLQDAPVNRRMTYRGTSTLGGRRGQDLDVPTRARNTALPAAGNQRSIEWAKQLRSEVASDGEYLSRLLQFFAEKDFYYTLRPPSLGSDPVDEFLFDTRRGFCGHYASAFTLLARAGGVPARVITGYQGAERNPLGNYWIVRQSDAHAWVETWVDGHWTRFDPTAMVAPDRIEFGFDRAMERRNETSPNLLANSPLLERIVMSWDALNTGWNRWVLSFGPETQSTIMNFVGIRHPSLEHLVIAMAVSITTLLIVIGIMQHLSSRPKKNEVLAAYERLCRHAGKFTRDRRPIEGPHEYLGVVRAQQPELAAELRVMFDMYVRLRYDGINDSRLRRNFIDAVRTFKPGAETVAG